MKLQFALLFYLSLLKTQKLERETRKIRECRRKLSNICRIELCEMR